MELRLKVDIEQIKKELGKYQSQVPFAASVAMNKVVAAARPLSQKLMASSYAGGPVAFTKRALFYTKSSKRNLRAALMAHPDAQYIITTAEGGKANLKPGRNASVAPVRGKTRLTAQGNVPYRQASKLLQNKKKYFSGKPRGFPQTDDYAGVWQRMGRGGRAKLRMVLKYDTDTPRPKSFPIYETLQEFAGPAFEKAFAEAMKKAIKTAWR